MLFDAQSDPLPISGQRVLTPRGGRKKFRRSAFPLYTDNVNDKCHFVFLPTDSRTRFLTRPLQSDTTQTRSESNEKSTWKDLVQSELLDSSAKVLEKSKTWTEDCNNNTSPILSPSLIYFRCSRNIIRRTDLSIRTIRYRIYVNLHRFPTLPLTPQRQRPTFC